MLSWPPLDVDEGPSFWRGCQGEVSTTGEGVAMSEQREQFRRRVEEERSASPPFLHLGNVVGPFRLAILVRDDQPQPERLGMPGP